MVMNQQIIAICLFLCVLIINIVAILHCILDYFLMYNVISHFSFKTIKKG